jgi:CDGSH-type Zn-finger protein
MAELPAIGGREPIEVEVKAGETFWWCRCGRSQTQPFCDGSHAGTPYEPLQWTATRPRTVFFCTCKRTRNPPFCDDSHLAL